MYLDLVVAALAAAQVIALAGAAVLAVALIVAGPLVRRRVARRASTTAAPASRLRSQRAPEVGTAPADERVEAPSNIQHRLMSLATAFDEPAPSAHVPAQRHAVAAPMANAIIPADEEEVEHVAAPGYSTGPLPALPPSPSHR